MNPDNVTKDWFVKCGGMTIPIHEIWRGIHLDAYADFFKLKRKCGESDLSLRNRILARIELEKE